MGAVLGIIDNIYLLYATHYIFGLCVLFLLLRCFFFARELRQYRRWYNVAKENRYDEEWFQYRENLSASSYRWVTRSGQYFENDEEDFYRNRKNTGASWFEVDRYWTDTHNGNDPIFRKPVYEERKEYGRKWITMHTSKDAAIRARGIMKVYEKNAIKANVLGGIEDYFQSCREAVVGKEKRFQNERFFASFYDRIRKEGYYLTGGRHFVAYCVDVFDRYGVPCLLLAEVGAKALQGFKLSYPLRGLAMKEARRMKGRMLVVDGICDDGGGMEQSTVLFDWRNVEELCRGIMPKGHVKTEVRNGERIINDESLIHTAEIFRRKNPKAKYSIRDVMIKCGLVHELRDVPDDMKIDFDSSDLICGKRNAISPCLDIFQIRVTPFVMDGVISFKEYVRYGCPVYNFSLYGARSVYDMYHTEKIVTEGFCEWYWYQKNVIAAGDWVLDEAYCVFVEKERCKELQGSRVDFLT